MGWGEGTRRILVTDSVNPYLLRVSSVHGVDHPPGVRVSLVGAVGRSAVQHGLINWVRGLVWKDACGQVGDQLLDLVDAAALHDVVVHHNVFPVELYLMRHVCEKASHLGSKVYNMGGFVLDKDSITFRPNSVH